MDNQFLINLVAKLQKSKSKSQVRADAKEIGQNIKIPLIGTLNKSKTKTQIKQDLASMKGTIQIDSKINTKNINKSVQQTIRQTQQTVKKNPIELEAKLEVKKSKLLNDIKVFGQQNSKLFKDVDMASKYSGLLNNAQLAQSADEIKEVRSQLSAMRSEIKANDLAGLSLGDTLKKTFKRATELFTGTGTVMLISQQMKEAWDQANELDSAFTDLIKVQDDLSRSDYPDYLSRCNEKAQELATTQKSLIEGATEFSKSGYNLSDSNALSEKSTILANVGDMSASDSAKAIISGVQAYEDVDGYTDAINKASALIDKYNEIGNTASITSAEIAQGVESVGSVFADANTSVDQFIALLSAGNRQYQDAASLALGLRTAALRIRGATVDLKKAGEETDGVMSMMKNRDAIKALTNVDILESDEKTIRSIYDIFLDISKVYQQMSDVDQSALLELIAGKHRSSGISAVLNNMSEAQQIYQNSLNATGSAQREYDKYMQSSEASMNKFKATMTETYQSILNGDTTKGILDAGNAVVSFANSFGLVESTLKGFVAIGIVKAMTTLSTAFKASAVSASNFGTAISNLKVMSSIVKNTSEYANAMTNLKSVTGSLSDTQLKYVLANTSLSNSERVAILQTTGLTKAQSKAKLVQLGLTESTKAQSAANATATASTFSLSAAVKGFSANLKATFLSNPIGIAVMGISTVIGVATSQISKYNEKVKEIRQANIDSANSASEKGQELVNLYQQYDNLNSVQERTTTQEEAFKTTVEDITKALGDKADALNGLSAGQKEYTKTLQEATQAELESQYATAQIGAKAAEDALKDDAWSSFSGSKITIKQPDTVTEADVSAIQEVKDVLSNYEKVITNNDLNLVTREWQPIDFDKNPEDMNAVVDYYNALVEAREKLATSDNSDVLMDSNIYKEINSTINDLSKSVETYSKQEYEALKLNYMWQNGIPTTKDELDKMEQSIIKTSGAGENFGKVLKEYLAQDFSGLSSDIDSVSNSMDNVKVKTEQVISSPQSFIEAWQALDTTEDDNLKNTKKDLLDLAEAGQLSANTLKSVQGAEDYFKAIGLSAQEASNKVNELVNSSQQLSSMRSGITSITGALDTKASEGMVSADKLSGFDVSLRGLETWDKFEETMGDTNSSMEDCKKAANELATEYVNSNNFLSQLTDTNKDYYISQLENMGVTNATEVVNASLVNSENALAVAQSEVTNLSDQQTDAKKKSYAASIDLSNATVAELQYLYNEANASGVASNGLRQLLASKLNANNVAIASAADCYALAQIYSSSESTKQSLLELAKAKAMALSHGNGGGQIYAQEKALDGKSKTAQQNINNFEKQTKVDVNVGGGAVSGGGGGGGNSKSKSKSTKTEIDWLERAMTRVGKQIDSFKSKLENLFTVDTKKNNIAEQLKLVKKEMSIADKQVSMYEKKANKVKLSKKLKTAVQEGRVKGSLKSLIAKYGEKTANKIQTYQNWYDKAQESKKTREELITTQRELQEQQYQLYVDDAQANIDKLNAQKDISAGYTAQNQKLDDQINYIKTSYEYQIKIAELTKDENKKAQLQAELTKELRDLEKEKFENIKEEYSSRISLIDAEADAIQSQMDQIEARGQIVGASYYESQIAYKNQDKAELQAELSSLQGQLALMEQVGDVGTKNWYDAKSAIADVQKQIFDCDTSILNMNNSITEVANTIYDKVIAGMKKFSTEADFMIGLMDDLENFDELSHTITDVGLANLGSYFTGKEVSKKQSEITKSIVEQMKSNLANGIYSYTDMFGNKRIYQSKEQMQDAIDSFYENWRDQINQTKEYNSKIIDFMRTKLQEELAAVQDLIDAKKDALSAEKDLHDYQKSITESTKNIGTIQAQITALQGDSSESAQARIQALQSQLEDAQDDLAEKQYERQISDEQDMLDNMYNKYSDLITAESQDTKALIEKGQALMDKNMATIKTTMDNYATDYGYTYQQLQDIFSGNSFKSFESGLNAKLDEVKTAIGSINIPSVNGGSNGASDGSNGSVNGVSNESETIKSAGAFGDIIMNPDSLDPTKNPLNFTPGIISDSITVKLKMTKKQVEDYIKKYASNPGKGKKKSDYGDLNKAIWDHTNGKVLSAKEEQNLAKKLGVSGKNYSKKSGALYKALKSLKIKGFSKGGLVSIDSIEKQVKENGDDGLISAQDGEIVLKPYDSELFKSFMQSDLIQKPSFADNLVKANVPDFSKIGKNTGNNKVEFTANLSFPNATKVDEKVVQEAMLKAVQSPSSPIRHAIVDNTIGQMNGTSRLGSNKYRI